MNKLSINTIKKACGGRRRLFLYTQQGAGDVKDSALQNLFAFHFRKEIESTI